MGIARPFLGMPLPLKILTAAPLAVPGFSIHSLFAQSVSVFGEELAASEWFASGAGIVSLAMSCLLVAAAVLILQRSRYGRPVYIGALVIMTLVIQVLAERFAAEPAAVELSLISNLLLTAMAAAYLYWSRAVRAYFELSSTETKGAE